ncbi:MFS transporter [Amphritea pacifica]|uniref:MFS transporter n=1 Tax=Amphritea pacifica TaxID=2811233 RepID=A0ABS2W4G0_9GAMM|nr:MFS transporter [Amphritea pacifica]MBN0986588.1 MFS transporter [Amphritea pacifica]
MTAQSGHGQRFRALLWGGLQLYAVLLLAALLLCAAYQRAGFGVDLSEIVLWGATAASTSLLLLLCVLGLRNRSGALTGKAMSRMMMGLTGAALGLLCWQHFWLGNKHLSLFDLATVLLIACLVSLELAVLQQSRCRQRRIEPERYKQMRPAIFLFLFGIDLSMAFIPLHMETLPRSFSGFSPDLLIGLPISVEFLCVGVAILCCGVWLDRSGWKPPFYTGLVLTGLGCFYSWLAPDAVQFILSRGVLGLGYGLTLLASQSYVIRNTDSSNKSRGLAHLFAGLYSGSICGAATGAVLAEQFGYGPVFLTGAVIVFSVIVYGWVTFGETPEPVTSIQGVHPDPQKPRLIGGFLTFLGDRQVLAAVLFSSMPASIAVVGFLNYFSPLYLNRAGVNDAAIGQVLMLFGVILALFGPATGRFADLSESKRTPIILGCMLGGFAFLVFAIFDGVIAVTLAILLLGLSNCLVLSAQSAFVLKQPVTAQYGEGKAMGIFRSSSRVGQMLGPVLFAAIIAMTDIESGVMLFGLAYLMTAILFALLTWAPTRVEAASQVKAVANE